MNFRSKNEIGIKQNSKFYSVFESISGSKKIAIQLSNQESDNYENGDTINSLIIFKSLKETLDPDDEFEPKLKELSRTVGTALLEYGNSDINSQTQKLDFFCANKKAEKGNTQLKENIEKLLKLENNYQAVDFGKITIKESNLINRFVNYVTHLDSVTNRINMTQNFNESIIEINFSNIKGIKEISSKLYPRARIEEYIFTSTDCAKKFLNNLDKILKTENDWYHIEKSPSSIYQHDNKIYFIISGGWYMKSFYKEIVNELNNPSDNNK